MRYHRSGTRLRHNAQCARYPEVVENPSFQRARSPENKRQRATALVDAARSLALEVGAASVTLTAVADRAGVHHSAMRRYFSSHKEILLQLAAEGWTQWSDTVADTLRDRAPAPPAAVAEAMANALAADPLFCDLLANVPLHLEHDVDVEHVAEFKGVSRSAVTALVTTIRNALPGLTQTAALDLVTSANATAATLWQVAHPPEALAEVYRSDPDISPAWAMDFLPTLTRLLTATCIGLLAAETTADPGEPER